MGLRWVDNNQAAVQPDLPEPEQVFFSWLMAQPLGASSLRQHRGRLPVL